MNHLSGASSAKDIELAERLANLRGEKKNNNNNNNNFSSFLPPPPLSPTPPPSPPDGGDGETDDDVDDNNDDDDNRNLTSAQIFFLNQPRRTGVALGTNKAAMSVPLQEEKGYLF